MDHYKKLDVSPTATLEEIKKAYRKLVMQYHPDRNPGDKKAEEEFIQIKESYDILSDSSRRLDFDRYKEDIEEDIGWVPDYQPNYSASKTYKATKEELNCIQCQFFGPGNILMHMTFTKNELANGTSKLVRWKKRLKCRCDNDKKCKDCKGSGITTELFVEEMMMEIPAGTPSGHQIILRGRGEPNTDNFYGNLHIVVIEST